MTEAAVTSNEVVSQGSEPVENFENWRAAVASIFDVSPLDPDFKSTFSAELTTYNAGNFLIGSSVASPLKFRRNESLVSAVGVDHFLFQLYCSGDGEIDTEGRTSKLKTGDLVCFDLSRRLSSWASDLHAVSLVVPRALVQLPQRTLDTAHGAVIDGNSPMATLLGQQLAALHDAAPRLSGTDLPLATTLASTLVTVGLSAACSRQLEDPNVMLPVNLQVIRAYIERNLSHLDLSPEMVCRHFAMSRSSLYRLFDPLGGVANYIRDRRLDRANLHLGSIGTGRGAVARLALLCGFSSDTAFARAFRQRFGVNPRDAIMHAEVRTRGAAPRLDPGRNWLQGWMESLAAGRSASSSTR
jgi:AraC-like DNA-binding protein